MLASLMGAVAFQKGLGIVHALSHPLSTLMDMHHGLANAVNLPYGLQYNQQGSEDRFYRMAQQMSLKEGGDIPQALMDFNERLNLPVNLSQCGIKEENLPELTELALTDFCLPLNPRPAGYQDILSIYQRALG